MDSLFTRCLGVVWKCSSKNIDSPNPSYVLNFKIITFIKVTDQFNYTKCDNAICFGFPENCLTTLNCMAVGKVLKINSSVYEFELQTIPEVNQTISPTYVAIVMSLDSRMEDDFIVECVMSNSVIEVFMSHTRQGPKGADRYEV